MLASTSHASRRLDASRAIAATEIGSTAKLVLVRADGKEKKELALEVRVERRPKDDDER